MAVLSIGTRRSSTSRDRPQGPPCYSTTLSTPRHRSRQTFAPAAKFTLIRILTPCTCRTAPASLQPANIDKAHLYCALRQELYKCSPGDINSGEYADQFLGLERVLNSPSRPAASGTAISTRCANGLDTRSDACIELRSQRGTSTTLAYTWATTTGLPLRSNRIASKLSNSSYTPNSKLLQLCYALGVLGGTPRARMTALVNCHPHRIRHRQL